ncbi:hypothetical protein PpBr36_01624 [Pyricularia pennisetigena]|uniref:hypothetical protein n=1 Tax=Pyricularia pennisetigena TaxID=1578925 RepID=UPI001152612B|nr:hypothetical protein PpBr36_01624 [Pyricularia pennisetigena]TLS27963.1 hypothetical protein PpBr36_01624 [Pyricularia pennisetigena]
MIDDFSIRPAPDARPRSGVGRVGLWAVRCSITDIINFWSPGDERSPLTSTCLRLSSWTQRQRTST